MPAIFTGKVLITGVNGFVAAWTAKAFLDAGFAVRGTVRSPSKAEGLKTIFGSYGDKFEAVVVRDMVEQGAFDEALSGVNAVVHAASPVHLSADDPSEVIDPAANGTLGVLRSAAQHASVSRVVYVSSCAAVLTRDSAAPRVYDETCWNDADVREVEEKGRAANPLAKYSASKTLAERRAWAWYKENKASLPWDLVVVNPPWVFGPVLDLDSSGAGPESMNSSNKALYDVITQGVFSISSNCWVDVRDLAHALLLAVTKPAAGGQRIIVSQGTFKWQDFVLAAQGIETSEKVRPLEVPYNP